MPPETIRRESAIRARIFNVNGAPAGDEFLVNTITNGDQRDPAIAALTDGGFVVTWTREFSSDDLDIRGRAFDADGSGARKRLHRRPDCRQ